MEIVADNIGHILLESSDNNTEFGWKLLLLITMNHDEHVSIDIDWSMMKIRWETREYFNNMDDEQRDHSANSKKGIVSSLRATIHVFALHWRIESPHI